MTKERRGKAGPQGAPEGERWQQGATRQGGASEEGWGGGRAPEASGKTERAGMALPGQLDLIVLA